MFDRFVWRFGLVGLVALLLLLAGSLFGGVFLYNAVTASTVHEHAVALADGWVNEIFTPEEARTARVSCQSTDSDDNGYVSCTLNVVRNGEEQLIPIECHAYVFVNFGDSCRPLVPLTLGVRR
jgi:hypothetical protein